jgi:ribonuclease J
MILTIHRGAHEIGGSCIEVAQDGVRIILDLGMPLVEPHDKKKKFDSFSVAKKSVAELITAGILPLVQGLYRDTKSEKPPDAILISHPHQDHYGLVDFARKDIPVYLADTMKLPEKWMAEYSIDLYGHNIHLTPSLVQNPYLYDHAIELGHAIGA